MHWIDKNMHLQTTSAESKLPSEYIDVIFIQIDQHFKKLLPKYKGVPILRNTVYISCTFHCVSEVTKWQSLERLSPPRRIKIGTVSLPASSRCVRVSEGD